MLTLYTGGCIGGETEARRSRPEEGRSPEAPGGDRSRQEGQEGLHDTREEEETSGRIFPIMGSHGISNVYFTLSFLL